MAIEYDNPALVLPPGCEWEYYDNRPYFGKLRKTYAVWMRGNELVWLCGYTTPAAAWAAAWATYNQPAPPTHEQRIMDLGLLSYKRR